MSTDVRTGTFAPLTHGTFLWFWIAFTVSTIGTSMQALGVQWFLVSDDGSAGLVALVQAALTLPMALLALPAGVLADRLDRRSLLVAVQVAAFVTGSVLTVIAWRGDLEPRLLLVLTLLLGSAYALTLTPFQSLIPDVVARSRIHAAAALVSVAANIARIVGPAAAGLLVATLGIPAVFAVSSLSSAFFVVVLLRWPGLGRNPTERERLLPAARSGVGYVRHSPQVLKLMLRAFWFAAAMMSLFALLPLVATQQLGTGAEGYGILFACLGAGAVAGGVSVISVRSLMTENAIVGTSFLVCAAVVGILPMVRWEPAAMACLFVGGWGWTACLSTMAGNVQVYLPSWVRARGLAIYSIALFSGQAVGSIVLGRVADAFGLSVAFWAAAGALTLGAPLAAWLPVVQLDDLDRSNAGTLGTHVSHLSGSASAAEDERTKGIPMAQLGVDNLENVTSVTLTPTERAALLERQTECTVIFAREGGWPVGIIMSFLHRDGVFWLTATDDRQQVLALARDPRMSIVVSNAGTGTWGRQMVSYRGVGVVHSDRAALDWFFPLWAERLAPGSAKEFIRLLDSPKRVLIEVRPVSVQASHDSRRMPGDGRGGPRPAEAATEGCGGSDRGHR